jgi:ubiquinone/menaquinone biosynthesis C-methylase UbiE
VSATTPPSATATENEEQIAYWNGPGGRKWLERQELQDALLAPVTRILLERAAALSGERVLDIGCGCGETALELARRVAPTGSVLGLDVSAPMLAHARTRRTAGLGVEFVEADATTYAFAPAQADLLFSRFGVMFFADPARSFANMRRALRADARLTFACWRTPRENPWLTLALQEAYRHVPRLPEMGPDDPGPFSFAAQARVRTILESAGFADVDFEGADVTLDLANGLGLDAAVDTAMDIGPTSRALEGQPDALRAAVRDSISAALAARLDGDSVPLAGAIWVVRARCAR